MAEWFKAPVLKTGNRKIRGFESLFLCQFGRLVQLRERRVCIAEVGGLNPPSSTI